MFSFSLRIVVAVLSISIFSSVTCDEPFSWALEGTVSAMFATQGLTDRMEDSYLLIENVNGTGIYGIFDGHSGNSSSKFAAFKLAELIETELIKCASNPRDCISSGELNGKLTIDGMLRYFIGRIESLLKTAYTVKKERSGTTCLIAIVEKKRLTVANVGDSRGVMCDSKGKAIPLSRDHRPDRPDEAQRIKEAGGKIELRGEWRVNGLAVSRFLGGFFQKGNDNVIIATPDILTFNLDEHEPSFMILASIGLWSVMTNQEAVDFVIKECSNEPDFGAQKLAAKAFFSFSLHNISIIIVKFTKGQYVVRSAYIGIRSANGGVRVPHIRK